MTRRSMLLALAILPLARTARASSWDEVTRYHRKAGGSSLLILRHGQTLLHDGDHQAHELASGAKSFWGVLACLLQEEGKLRLDETLGVTLPEWRGDPRGEITLHQLLTLSSGLGGGAIGRPPTFQEALQTQLTARPGTVFQYGPAPYQVFGEFLRRRLQTDPLEALQSRVLRPAGVRFESWKRGEDGNLHLPSGARLTAANWSQFGLWVTAQRQRLQPCFQGTKANPAYGLTWWLNRPLSPAVEQDLGRAMRNVASLSHDSFLPRDLSMAAGAGDQRLYLIPSLDLVIARQADRIVRRMLERANHWQDTEFLRKVCGILSS